MFDNPNVFSINKLKYFFYVQGFRGRQFINFQGKITFCPRVGDQINLPFLRHYLGVGLLYVENIEHEFTDTQQIISISLKHGFYNQYETFGKDEDYANGYMSDEEYFS